MALRPITPEGEHYCFGYYDRCPWSPDNRYHLALRIPQQDHLPRQDEKATVCAIDLEDNNRIIDVDTTFAWNHQQGSMTHWLPNEPNHIIFNDRDGDCVFSRVVDISGHKIRELPRPVYCLDPSGRLAASLDFARIPRRGYSYAVPNGGPNLEDDDGLWVMDISTGNPKLICSYADLAAIHPYPSHLDGSTYCWLNHAIFNCDGSRLMVLLRYEMNGRRRMTFIYTMDPDGGNLRCALDQARWAAGQVTHQIWGRKPDELLIDADFAMRGDGVFTVFSDSDRPIFTEIAPQVQAHGHQTFSPNGEWVVTDTYPRNRYQDLKIVRVSDGYCRDLARMYHQPPKNHRGEYDMRCDLHPRWRPDGKAISIDSINDRWRRIYIIDTPEVSRR